MSRSGKTSLEFGDRTHDFALRLAELEELQEACDAGPPVVLNRLGGIGQNGSFALGPSWTTKDVRETIRLGLIGGGMHVHKARALVTRYVDDRPDWFLNAKVAFAILAAALMGVEDEPDVGEPEGEAATDANSPRSQMESGDLPTSTAPPAPSAKTSKVAASGTSSASSRAGTARKAKPPKTKPRRTSASKA